MSASGIFGARGLTPPPLQAAGKQDGGGNGDGGMYFGQDQQDQQQQPYFGDYGFGYNDDTETPFYKPIEASKTDAMQLWRAAIAQVLYSQVLNASEN